MICYAAREEQRHRDSMQALRRSLDRAAHPSLVAALNERRRQMGLEPIPAVGNPLLPPPSVNRACRTAGRPGRWLGLRQRAERLVPRLRRNLRRTR